MKLILAVCFLVTALSISAAESNVIQMTTAAIQAAEKKGVRYYKKGDYEKAFHHLLESAKQGMKQPQYLLGMMYLKGQYVDRELDTGLAWLGVANEMGASKWQNTYDGIYAKLNDPQKLYIDKKIGVYIEQYGMKAQDIICHKKSLSRRAKPKIMCGKKSDGSFEDSSYDHGTAITNIAG